MRGFSTTALLTLSFAVALTSLALAGESLKAVRVAPPAALERLKLKGRPVNALPMRPEELEAQSLREQRWRGFHDVLSRPGVRWGSDERRRVGWRPPLPEARRPGGGPSASNGTADVIRVAFIRVDFGADRGGGASSGDGRFDLSGPDPQVPPIDRPPHNLAFYQAHGVALHRFYDVMSYGRADVQVDVWPRTPNGAYTVSDMADFGPWKFSQDIYGAAVHMFQTMLHAAHDQAVALGDSIPFDSYDRFVLIHAGGDFQSDIRQDSPEDIPSFTLGVVDSEAVVFPGSTRPIDRAAVVPETINQDGYYGAINGVMAHECGHLLFDYVDLYDVETGFPVVGLWSLMDSGNLVGTRVLLADSSIIFATGLLPPSVDPFHRSFTPAVNPGFVYTPVLWNANLALPASERDPVMYQIPLSSDEFLVLENRYQSPADLVELDQDSVTRVILGPKNPDRFEYDALLPGTGTLVWHIDDSVIPYASSMRINPDYFVNTNPRRLGVQIIEADGLDDLGDPGSPFILGGPFDPWFKSNLGRLSDTTIPNLRPNIGTRPHVTIDFPDDPAATMHFTARRDWQLTGWPIAADVPPDGPQLLTVDADGDRLPDVCWAGGDTASADSAGLFAVKASGAGINGPSLRFAVLDRRPRQPLAAIPTDPGGTAPDDGPSLFAATTVWLGAGDAVGGKVWLVDHLGASVPGWPVALPSPATTAPVIAGIYPTARVFVGCANGRVYSIDLSGTVQSESAPALPAPITGRLAAASLAPLGRPGEFLVAAGDSAGDLALVDGASLASGWPRRISGPGFAPDFLWIDFGGAGSAAEPACGRGMPSLVVHDADRLWALCADGASLSGAWGRSFGDTLVAGLGAGDPDGDGFPEVLIQTLHSKIAFINRDGNPSPGWPKPGTSEGFRTTSPPLGVDLDGDGRGDVVALNASGILAALTSSGKVPDGWPLATGVGATGTAVAADLMRDGGLDIVAPDRFGGLYAYTVPGSDTDPVTTSWTMLGGDPGRTGALPPQRTPTAIAPGPGPLIQGSLMAYPNPARRKPVRFAYRLSEDADVEFRILDTSGHQVASFTRRGLRSDNVEVWDPGSLPGGLYLAHLRFRGSSSERSAVVAVGLIR